MASQTLSGLRVAILVTDGFEQVGDQATPRATRVASLAHVAAHRSGSGGVAVFMLALSLAPP